MITFRKRATLAAVGAAVVAGGLTLALGMASAGAQVAGHGKTPPGDNGDVKIHNSGTAATDERNEPHVCAFYLDAFNFDPAQSVSWWIESWPGTGSRSVVDTGTITLDSSGGGVTAIQTLPDGHYKLFWTFAGEKGAAKQKVFWVSCQATPPTTPPPTTPPPTTAPPTTAPPTTAPPTTAPPTTAPPTTAPPTSPPPSTTSPGPTPSPTSPGSTPPSTTPPTAPVPTPVQTNLPVTG